MNTTETRFASAQRQEGTPVTPGHTGVPGVGDPVAPTYGCALPDLPESPWPTGVRCPVREVLDRVGDTWSVLVVLRLGHSGTLRFRELLRAVDGISQRMLTLTLRALEREGLVLRTVHAELRPVAVDYTLTPLGRSLLAPVAALAAWAMHNDAEVRAARRRFDEQQATADKPQPGVQLHRIV